MSFFLNVVSSVLTSIIVILAAGLLSRTARSMLVGALGRLVDIDVETVFRNPREAAPDLRRELERAGRVDLLTGRGSELERETFAGLLGAGAGIRRRPFRLLLPDPRPVGEATDWTADLTDLGEVELVAHQPRGAAPVDAQARHTHPWRRRSRARGQRAGQLARQAQHAHHSGGQARRLSRPVRGVLRLPAREDGPLDQRRARHRVREVGRVHAAAVESAVDK